MINSIYPKKPGRSHIGCWLMTIFIVLVGFYSGNVSAQDLTVTGTVKTAAGETMPGANVSVKGTSQGAITNLEGEFSITVPSREAILVFSFIGYESKEVKVGNQTTIDVTLAENLSALNEVVVVGYGSQERAKVTGAISSVSSEEIRELPVPNLASAMQGRAANVSVTNAGAPGADPVVRIRGIGTVGDNDPLYVIDGMPASGLNQINPADIESIEVLKDASTAAIYGSRAANGVVLVTTKKGTKGKPKVSLDAYYGVQNAWRTLDLLNVDQYLDFGRDLVNNANDPDVTIPPRFDDLGEFANVHTDWQDEMFQSAPIQDYNVSVSGGGENSLYNISMGYFAQDGIMQGVDFERVSFRANTQFDLGERVSVGQTLTVSYTDRNDEPFSGGRSQMEHMVKMVPYIPVRDPSRQGGFRGTDTEDGSDPENPVLNAVLRQDRYQDFKILGSAYIDVEILDGFHYKFMTGLDIATGQRNEYTPMFNAGDFQFQVFAAISQTRNSYVSPLFSNQFSYTKDFGGHHLDLLAVIEKQTFISSSLTGSGQNELTNDVRELQGVQNQVTTSEKTEYGLISYVGRVNYDYKQKYLLSASIRRDGGSRFGPDNKWGVFPSVSAGWRVSEEDFMQGVGAISDLKLRASYGQTGNDRIGDYVYQATINSNMFYNFNGTLAGGSTINALANEDLKWETTIMKNVGLDLGILNDQITFTAEWFDNKTEDMILGVPVPPSLGFDVAPVANVGTVRNRGMEFTAGYQKKTGAFQFGVNGNIGFVDNELISLGSGNSIFGPTFQGDPMTYTEEGKPIAYFYGWEVEGIFQSGEDTSQQPNAQAGDLKFRDINEDGTIDADDRTNLGHYMPDFTYGLNFNANFKNFDLSLFLQGVQGNEIFSNIRFHTEGMTRLFNASTAVLDRWTPDNTQTDVPRAISGDPNGNARASSRWVEDGSYARLKNLSIGYTVPNAFLQSIAKNSISNLRVYVSAQNLFTITDYSGYDPEIAARTEIDQSLGMGIDFGQFPAARTFIGGIQLTF
ncbi:TonB-dependent receptor [Echinicola strongylocentroti]|uniref:TonB-dependent receptor n=1 Tax=Echinicola strongylocentroti TaxID=1795355 RepID=A0A2Z4IH85_9BACT|nr:TonB-dependent receptor [Echinicola strongylocentroti]AWW29773.1 TonB-dependent receptor [Echinicola strongylocentroti]